MRVGVFGGTFDPVHLGHLILAERCREQGRLEEVWFVPAARPPHKHAGELTRFEQRVEMLALALAGNPAFRIEELEKERPGPSYTVDTLTQLRQRRPAAELWLIVGGDTLVDLPHWHDPAGVLTQAGLLVVPRPGHDLLSAADLCQRLGLPAQSLRMEIVPTPLIDVSSRELRQRAGAGLSLRYVVPRAVECYIQDRKLYRPGSDMPK